MAIVFGAWTAALSLLPQKNHTVVWLWGLYCGESADGAGKNRVWVAEARRQRAELGVDCGRN